jgi:hypothetical protein
MKVESRERMVPTLRPPTISVRVIEDWLSWCGPGALEAPTSALDRVERCAKGCLRSHITRTQCAELCGRRQTQPES